MRAHGLKIALIFVVLCIVVFLSLVLNGNTVYTYENNTPAPISPSPILSPAPITPAVPTIHPPTSLPAVPTIPPPTSLPAVPTAFPVLTVAFTDIPGQSYIQPTLVDSDRDDIPDSADRCPSVASSDTVDGCLYRGTGPYAVVARQVSRGNSLNEHLDVFAMSDGDLHHIVWENHRVEWDSMSGTWVGEPVAISTATGRIEVFSTDESSYLYSTVWENGMWSEWRKVPDAITNSTPSIIASENRLDLFTVGTDGDIWYNWRVNDIWHDWRSLKLTNLGVKAASVPVAVMPVSGEIFVFVRDSNNALQYITEKDDTWSQWSKIRDGQLTAAPAVLVSAPNHVDVFVVGLQSTLWHIGWDGQEWDDEWSELGSDRLITSAPSVVKGPNETIAVFVQAKQDKLDQLVLWHAIWGGQHWLDSESWEGILVGDPIAFAWSDTIGAVCLGVSDKLWFRSKRDGSLEPQPWESLMALES